MSVEENKELVRRHYEAANNHDATAAYAVVSQDCIFHLGGRDFSVAQAKEFDRAWLTAFPDASYTIEKMIAEGDLVAFRIIARGTHLGELFGHAATGKKMTMTNANWFRVANGQLVEFWASSDRLALMQQLGLITENI